MRALFTTLGLLFSMGEAIAQPSCQDYASEAIDKTTFARNIGCKFTGARWSTDINVHLRWCRTASPSAVDDEAYERRNGLFNCNRCLAYANTSAAQARRARQLRCNYEGPVWQTGPSGHYDWCMASDLGPGITLDLQLTHEIGVRAQLIARCEENLMREAVRPQERVGQRATLRPFDIFGVRPQQRVGSPKTRRPPSP